MTERKKIIWIYSPAKSGDFGFVDVDWQEKWYYVHWFNKKDALPWDKVLAELKTFRWKDEAVIKKVLQRSDKIFIWTFQEWKKQISKINNKEFISFGFVIVRDDTFKVDIFIPWKYIKNAKTWDLVWVKIISWDKKAPNWKIVKVLWDSKNENLVVESFILEAWFKQSFSRETFNELKKISDKIDIKKSLGKWRKDLRKLFTFTIDWEDAKDLDDAISIEKRTNWNFELYVHIADVSNYIKEWWYLDKEALLSATSVYLPDRVIPMLPEKLSNNLCSLNPDTPKLTLTCEMLIWKDWVIRKNKVYESLIESNFRLTYKEVDNIVKGKNINWKKLFWGQFLSNELIEKIKDSWELKEKLEKNKQNIWVLDFDFPETKIILDDKKDVIDIKQYPRYDSNKLIELFMVSANESVAKTYANLPFLHRIHPEPSQEDIEKLQKSLNLFWINFRLTKFDTKEFSNLLKIIEKSPNKNILEKIILRTLSKAIYSTKNEGHFWLWLEYYSHFTSPIRRYPDLQIHRIIKEKINKKLDKKRIIHYETILENIALKCSTQERNAQNLEYKVKDYYIVKYYQDKVWKIFKSKISWLIPKWFFVMLENTAEWFVDLNNLDNFIYNEELMQFEDKKTKKIYRLWDDIKVELIDASLKDIRLTFEIV